jgi:hypothetical protein
VLVITHLATVAATWKACQFRWRRFEVEARSATTLHVSISAGP